MLRSTLHPLVLALSAIAVVSGCSGEGEMVVDPNSGMRTETALIAVDRGSAGELLRYVENSGLVSSSAYAEANAGTELGMPIDAIFTSFDKLFLHHREQGSITVLDIETGKRRGVLTGFPASADSGLCDMAFSNLSEAWVVAFNTRKLFLVDAVNLTPLIDQAIDLPGNPTSVGTAGTRVLVGMVMPDGSAGVAVLRSNNPPYPIDLVMNFDSPVVHITANSDANELLLVTAGVPGGSPTLHAYDVATLEKLSETVLPGSDLNHYVGQEPTFAALSNDFFLYVSTPEALVRVDTRSRQKKRASAIIQGSYPVIGVDYFTSLIYLWSPQRREVLRFRASGEQLSSVAVAEPVTAISFVRQNHSR